MAAYDSDSSGGGDDYTETNVLLGYATKETTEDAISHLGGFPAWLDDGKTNPSGALAKCKVCNGLLTLLLELNGDMPDRFPGHERRICIFGCRRKTCRRKAGSVRGIRGVRGSKAQGHNAAAGAAQKTSSSSAKAPASSPAPAAAEQSKPPSLLGNKLFGTSKTPNAAAPANPFANPFSMGNSTASNNNPFSTTSSNPFSTPAVAPAAAAPTPSLSASTSSPSPAKDLSQTFASKARISSPPPEESQQKQKQPQQAARPHEPWPAQSDFPPPYPYYSLDADYETLDSTEPAIPQATIMDLDEPGSSSSGAGGGGSGAEDRTAYESTIDKTFQRFADRLAQNPEQVLRYEFGGSPLLYSKDDALARGLGGGASGTSTKVRTATSSAAAAGPSFPRCPNCNAARVFEVQLTPHAITELEADEEGIDGMEWGTVLLAVCERDCAPSDVAEGEIGFLEEWVGVQWEEMRSKNS